MKSITIKKNLLSGIIAIAAGIILLVMMPYAIKSKVNTVTSAIGPTYMPTLIAAVMIICGIGLVVQSLFFKKEETITIELNRDAYVLLYAVLLVVAYAILMPLIGFFITSIAFSICSLLIMEDKNKVHFILAIALVSLIFFGFKYGLSVKLPSLFL